MPAQHAGVRVVLVLAIDLLDVGRRGSAEGDNDVDVLQDHTGAVELKLDVDVDDAPCAVVLRPAVDGERSSVLSGVGPAKDTDGTADGKLLAPLEGEGSFGLVVLLADLGMGGEGEGLAGQDGLVDDDDGGGPGVRVGRESEGALDVAGLDSPLAVHLARYLLLDGDADWDRRGCRRGRHGWSRQAKCIGPAPLRDGALLGESSGD